LVSIFVTIINPSFNYNNPTIIFPNFNYSIHFLNFRLNFKLVDYLTIIVTFNNSSVTFIISPIDYTVIPITFIEVFKPIFEKVVKMNMIQEF